MAHLSFGCGDPGVARRRGLVLDVVLEDRELGEGRPLEVVAVAVLTDNRA